MTTKSLVLAAACALSVFAYAETSEELEKIFDAAVKAGEPLKADQAFRELVSKKPGTAAIRYYQAAEVSRELGKTTDRRSRLAQYLRAEKQWSEKTEQAAWEMCRNAGSADQYIILCNKIAASGSLYSAGSYLLGHYRGQKRAADFKKVAFGMLEKFKEDAQREGILGHVAAALMEGMPGFTQDDAFGFFNRYPVKNYSCLDWPLRHRPDIFTPMWRLRTMAKNQALLIDPGFDRMYNFNRKDEHEVAEARKCLDQIEKLCLDGSRWTPAYWWYRTRIDIRGQYFKPNQTNEMSKAYLALFDRVAAVKNPDLNSMRDLLRWTCESCLVPADRVAICAKYPKFCTSDVVLGWGGLNAACDKAKNCAAISAFLQKNPDRHDVQWDALRRLASGGDIARMKEEIERRIMEITDNRIDCWHIFYAIREAKMNDKDRVDFMKALYTKSGAQHFWNWYKAEKNQDLNRTLFVTNAYGKAFRDSISDKAKSNIRLVEIRREILSLGRGQGNICPDKAHQLYAEAAKLLGGKYPLQGKWLENMLFGRIQGHYLDLCQHNLTSAPICVKAVDAMLQPKNAEVWRGAYSWNNCAWNSRDAKDGTYYNHHVAMAQNTGDAGYITGFAMPKNEKGELMTKLPDGIDMSKVGDQNAVARFIWDRNVIWHNGQLSIAPELAAAIVTQWFKQNEINKADSETKERFFASCRRLADAKAGVFAQFPFDKVAAEILDKDVNAGLAREFLSFTVSCGKGRQYLDRYLNMLAKLEPVMRFNRVRPLMEMENLTYFGNAEKKIVDVFTPVFKAHYMPALKAIPLKAAPLSDVGNPNLIRRVWAARDGNPKDEELKKLVNDFVTANLRLKNNGAAGWDQDPNASGLCYLSALDMALQASNVVAMAEVAEMAGRRMNPWANGWEWMSRSLDRAQKDQRWETLYLMANACQNFGGDFQTKVVKMRAEASTHLPGVYPVTEKDPLYPLYVAADEFNKKNFEKATQLLMDKKNLAVFEREAIKLPPDFVAWGVEQLRLERGTKDSMLIKARNLATKLLENESLLTPELAASMVLVRAECYRDEQNFEAAKLEYQTIRNAKAYQGTKAARKAMFRSIDLMIDTGNSSGTESTLEYWLSQPDTEVQAQAHYFLARIAFEHKDYDECRKQLKEVFAIDFTHTEGRFLEGKWKLATGNEVDDTQVMIGQLSDRTMIRPGQQLAISVQDRNLSVAGGGASIPVLITTKPGGDRERIYLYPTARDPSNFKGVIDVKVGEPVCSNLVLEVTGNDTATYSIDPEFLKSRGLEINESKALRVVDDARLAIGAGVPKTADGEEAADKGAAIERMVTSGEEAGFRPPLRPGNPLYIAVSDKDRCLGKDSEVSVRVNTTSGDRLENVVLKETKPFSGVFRGEIPTSLPPPRAFASDTAVGFNACDVINSTKDGEWKSLADGGSGKWFAVDTMDSHEFSNIVYRMKAPEEVRAVRLTGTIGGEVLNLGQFPSGKPESRVGLRVQSQWDVPESIARQGAGSLRAFWDRPDAAKVSVVTNLAFNCPSHHSSRMYVYFNGAFMMPGGHDSLRLVLVPKTTIGNTFKTATVSVLLDGKTILEGAGPDLVNQLVTPAITPGVHRLEVFASGRNPDDSWTLMWEPFGEPQRLIPADWFNAKQHQEIIDYLADKAKLQRTDSGFEAVFRVPVRLRTIKLEYLDRIGPDAQISAVEATDWQGKKILPVESDFSDAQKNETLEVAPGDRISVSYVDEKTTKGESRILTKTVNSSFTDATVGFYFEDVVVDQYGKNVSTLFPAFRFVPGDSLLVGVYDSDLDETDEADRVKVKIQTKDGKVRELTLIEQEKEYGGVGGHVNNDVEGVHTGFFLGIIRTCPESVTDKPKCLRCSNEESLLVSYVDRENTKPGVAFTRTARVNATRPVNPQITLFHTRAFQVEDTSAAAKEKLEKIRRRNGNENVQKLYTTTVVAIPMNRKVCNSTNDIPVNVATPLPIRVNDPSRAKHKNSRMILEAVAQSELDRAERDGDDPELVKCYLGLAKQFNSCKLNKGGESQEEAILAGSFNGELKFAIGGVDPSLDNQFQNFDPMSRPAIVPVNGSDRVFITVKDQDGKELLKRTIKFVSNATLALMDSTWTAERNAAHVGERFYIRVEDPDRDLTDNSDRIMVDVETTGGAKRKAVLSETLPHSGVFAGMVRPIIFAPNETIPSIVTGAQATAEQLLAEDRLAIKYGDRVTVSYADEIVLPGTKPHTLTVTGMIHKGANGDVRLFSKRFKDQDMAILVQFRLAECLFEQAKEFRKLKQAAKSAEAIDKGKGILEEALKNNPESSHIAQGEFLLANLYQELASEEKQKKPDERDEVKMKQLFGEALARFSSILAVWPEGEFAPRSQYHKAYCLEMLGEYKLAGEEYVKMTYIYPESDLVGDATIRLATYYFSLEKKYDTAARIYANFAKRFAQHEKAPKALFMAGSCFVKQGDVVYQQALEAAKKAYENDKRPVEKKGAFRGLQTAPPEAIENFQRAVTCFDDMNEKYRTVTTPELRAQALYWAGDASLRAEDPKHSYLYLKRTILEYPETEWARRARGLLLQNGKKFKEIEK